jgi:hypothetical protein
MHTAPMPDSAGDFGEFKPSDNEWSRARHKPGCESRDVRVRLWESHCGGYEDYQYRCFGCGATWWVEGIDS